MVSNMFYVLPHQTCSLGDGSHVWFTHLGSHVTPNAFSCIPEQLLALWLLMLGVTTVAHRYV